MSTTDTTTTEQVRNRRAARLITEAIGHAVHPDHGPVLVYQATADRAGVLVRYQHPNGTTGTRDLSRWPQLADAVTAADHAAIARTAAVTDAHQAAGDRLCTGDCGRWLGPADTDDWGTCGSVSCLRTGVTP